jgi:hypothetical protein
MADKILEGFALTDEPRIWAGHGSGKLCAHCHRPILANDIEFEVILPQSATASNAVEPALILHPRCHDEWRRSAGSHLSRPRGG